jgi:hypothetical protein
MAYIVFGPGGPGATAPLGVTVDGTAEEVANSLGGSRDGYVKLKIVGTDRDVHVNPGQVLWVEETVRY